jgi:acetyltransferase-like isoleucine patch superfamily enzyme
MTIGNKNQFHAGCIISAESIGSHNEFGAFCVIDEGVRIGDHCMVQVKVHVPSYSILPNKAAQFSDIKSRISAIQPSIHDMHMDYLYETLPKYHSIQ